jgi:hypothetical protein
MSEEEIERLKHRRNQLNTYVESLHKTRQPSNTSAYKILNEVAKLGSLPLIPSGYMSFSTLDQKTIFSLEEQINYLQNSWVVVEEGAEFPWSGCKATTYTLDVRNEWTNLLTSLIDATKQLHSNANDYCEKLRLDTPKSLESYDTLQRLANIIEATPHPPQRWLQDVDLTKVQQESEAHKLKWGEYWEIRTDLERRYDSRFRSLPRGTAERVEETWKKASELLQPNLKGDRDILKHLDDLIKFLDHTIRDADKWGELTEKISAILGLPTDTLTITMARRIHRITKLCESTNKPDRSWLTKADLEQAEKYLEKAKAQRLKRDELKSKLTAYRDEVTSLDLPTIITYLEGPWSSPLRYLRTSYYNIRDEISSATITGEIPINVLQDLKLALELKELQKTVASEQEEAKSRLGAYYRDGNPDLEAAGEAINNAKEILHLIHSSRAPKLTRDNLCIATKPSDELLTLSRSLGASLQSWRAAQKPLRVILPERNPNGKTRIVNLPLRELKDCA